MTTRNLSSRRRALKAIAATGAASLAGPLHVSRVFAQGNAPIRIGVVLPLSGAYAAQGTAGARGIQFLAEQTNAKGGLLGRQLEVLVEDSQLKPQTAVIKATKLIKQDGCQFLMGEISGASTLALLEVADREKTVMVTPYSSPEAVTGTRGTRYQFRTYSNAYIQAAIAADYVTKNIGKKWGVMAADYAYGQDYTNHLRRFVPKLGGQIVSEAFPALGTTDFVSHLQQASSGNPDVLWMVEYGRDATVALNQAASMGLKGKMALGLAVANTLAAIEAGARQVECTINGIGERAGNASLEEIVMALHVRADRLPFRTNIVTNELYSTSRLLSEIVGFDVQPNKAIVGRNAFAHEAGIHQHGVINNPLCYEIMTPESVGVPGSSFVLGKHSGRHALNLRCEQLGFRLERRDLDRIYRQFVALADRHKSVGDQQILELVAHYRGTSFESDEGSVAPQRTGGTGSSHADESLASRFPLSYLAKGAGSHQTTTPPFAREHDGEQQEDYLWGV